jgi:hypothetical protein
MGSSAIPVSTACGSFAASKFRRTEGSVRLAPSDPSTNADRNWLSSSGLVIPSSKHTLAVCADRFVIGVSTNVFVHLKDEQHVASKSKVSQCLDCRTTGAAGSRVRLSSLCGESRRVPTPEICSNQTSSEVNDCGSWFCRSVDSVAQNSRERIASVGHTFFACSE